MDEAISLNPAPPLLAADEPPAAALVNPAGAADLVLCCDHASNRVPRKLGDLGVAADQFNRHIAYDIGAEAVTRRLSASLDARAVIAGYSRLVVDLNRPPGHPDGMPNISDKTVIPANRGLTPGARAERLDQLFDPYHNLLRQALSGVWAERRPPALFSVHSFTASMGDTPRPWDVGVLWNRDPRIARPIIKALHDEGLDVGDNLPYSGRELAYTINVHGAAQGLANCVIEINQDQVRDEAGQARWADILHRVLTLMIADDGLFRVELH
ncbi:MAG: N-formylglutamate amidohydrolase [Rhodospirillaceae bacterium]